MPIRATFPAGVNEIIVHGLHQWDYGQTLEIASPDIPAMIEVHFAHSGMKEAIVRVGASMGDVIEVKIPDRCLEQGAPIVAWVYEIGETHGSTIKTITMPIIKRPRPQSCEDVPAEVLNLYNEAVAAMTKVANEAKDALWGIDAKMADTVKRLEDGDVTVKNAQYAANAGNADYAQSANKADFLRNAFQERVTHGAGQSRISLADEYPGYYLVTFYDSNQYGYAAEYSAVIYFDQTNLSNNLPVIVEVATLTDNVNEGREKLYFGINITDTTVELVAMKGTSVYTAETFNLSSFQHFSTMLICAV